MYFEIEDDPRTLDNSQTRTVVLFWASRAEYLRDRDKTDWLRREDFITNVQPFGSRIVTDERGWWKLVDGSFVDPAELDPAVEYEFEREDYEIDMADVLLEHIENYLDTVHEDGTTNAQRIRAGDRRVDRTSRALELRQLPREERAEWLRSQRVRDIVRSPREPRTREERERARRERER